MPRCLPILASFLINLWTILLPTSTPRILINLILALRNIFYQIAFRSWRRFFNDFQCQLASILSLSPSNKPSKSHQNPISKGIDCLIDLDIVFYWFCFEFGNQIGSKLATFFSRPSAPSIWIISKGWFSVHIWDKIEVLIGHSHQKRRPEAVDQEFRLYFGRFWLLDRSQRRENG